MDRKDNISERLKVLLEEYDFNVETLSKFLELSVAQIKTLAEGNVDFLPEDATYRFRLFNKISFLYSSVVEEQYLKLCEFLQALISYNGLSKKQSQKWQAWRKRILTKFCQTHRKRFRTKLSLRLRLPLWR